MIDTHCHLTFPEFRGREDGIMDAARAVGVWGAITISTTSVDCVEAMGVAHRVPGVWCTSGVHPLYADRGPHDWATIERVARDARCVAWGELGLDNHYKDPAKDVQLATLREQLGVIARVNREIGKPVVIHCREAFDELIPILRESGLPADRFVFHCFTGNEREVRLILEFGAMVSFTGVVTYANAQEVRAAAALVPVDRMMVETDAPFLTPAPHRGVRPNEPRFVVHVAEALAQIKGMGVEDLERALDANAMRFFGVDRPVR
jgi:TatD DNase family protein